MLATEIGAIWLLIVYMIRFVHSAQLAQVASRVVWLGLFALSGCQQIQDRLSASFVAPEIPAVSAAANPASAPVHPQKRASTTNSKTATAELDSVTEHHASESSTEMSVSLTPESKEVSPPPDEKYVLPTPNRPTIPKPHVSDPPELVVAGHLAEQPSQVQRQKTSKIQRPVKIQAMTRTPTQQAVQHPAIASPTRMPEISSAVKAPPRAATRQTSPTRQGVILVDEEGNPLQPDASGRDNHTTVPITIQE